MPWRTLLPLVLLTLTTAPRVFAQAPDRPERIEHRVLATSRTSTLEKELNDAARAGFRFQIVMGGETAASGGKEVVAIVSRAEGTRAMYEYKLLATSRTSKMEKELQEAAEAGFDYRGQTVFDSTFGGKEVVCILERNLDARGAPAISFKLLATARTSTMQNELLAAGADGYEAVGMTVAKTAFGGDELVTILRRQQR
jgi:hypothetical protein